MPADGAGIAVVSVGGRRVRRARLRRPPDYVLEVLLDQPEPNAEAVDEPGKDSPARWRLLILEDTGELLAADAKELRDRASRAC